MLPFFMLDFSAKGNGDSARKLAGKAFIQGVFYSYKNI
jgi:hypothetical protein